MPGNELHVLKDITLDFYRGEIAAVTGPSGVGKSTLLHILGTLDSPSSGKVLYKNNDVFSLKNEMLAKFRNETIGFVFQFHHLLPEFNAIENVMMPLIISGAHRKDAYRRAEEVLGEVGLSERLNHKPGELSGGEQQRVAVARALVQNPEVVLADEPTGNLDTQTGEALFDLFIELNRTRDITFIIITHNESIASRCGRIIRMRDGRIVS
jgi:lipoprotein-releasing system ATP-binding protein